MKLTRWFTLLFALLVSLLSFGCGGSSGATTGGGRTVNLFVSDSFRDDYDQVWGTVYRVEVTNPDGSSDVLYESTTGQVFDFKRLRDGSGARFAFLNQADVSPGPWNRIRLTLGSTLRCVPAGQTTATDLTVVGDGAAVGGQVTVTRNLPAPKLFVEDESFVIDFDLANFVVAGSNVTPSIIEGDDTGIGSLGRHEDDDIEGIVSGIVGTAPNQEFDLDLGGSRFLRVKLNSGTTIRNESAFGSPTLTNGRRVEVTGVFETATQSLIARDVKIEDEQGDDSPEIKGSPRDINAQARTFKVNVTSVFGFVPPGTFVNVVTTNTTRFLNDSGLQMTEQDFYTGLLVSGNSVEVEGTYNTNTNTLTARKAKLDDEDDMANDVEANGSVITASNTGSIITMNVSSFFGWSFPGGNLTVNLNSNTTFRDDNGETISRADFFGAISQGSLIEAEGTLVNGNTILAKKLKLDND